MKVKEEKIKIKHGPFIKEPKCQICGVDLTHEWLDGDYTLLMCDKEECWGELNKTKIVNTNIN